MSELDFPRLVIDEGKCKANIRVMAAKLRNAQVRFRPHFKTHQSLAMGRWFRDEGVSAITVSSLQMADYFTRDGWRDITMAVPFSPLEAPLINKVAATASLHLITASPEAVKGLGPLLQHPVNLWIKIDAGYGRAGVKPEEEGIITAIAKEAAQWPLIQLKGLLGHAGHSYQARDHAGIMQVHESSLAIMAAAKAKYQSLIPGMEISLGDTPTCSIASQWPGVDELRPGNFVFYDLQQSQITSCTDDQIAVAMVCPIVDLRADRSEVIVHGGSVHFAKDWMKEADERLTFGCVAEKAEKGWGKVRRDWRLRSLSQEHGVLSVPAQDFSQFNVGDWLYILPVHSCLAADAMCGYYSTEGDYYDHFKTGYRR